MKEQTIKTATKTQPAAKQQTLSTKPARAQRSPKAKPQPTKENKPTEKPKTVTRKPYTRKAKPAQPSAPTALQTISNAAKTPEYTPAIIKKLMAKLDMNEKAFAYVMNVSPVTVKYWIAGAVKPCSISRRLMQILDESPALAVDVLAGWRYQNVR